jgi:hypothetical protein
MSSRRLFFGFEARASWLCVIAVDDAGRLVLRLTFPLPDDPDTDILRGPARDILHCLKAFVAAHRAETVCGIPDSPLLLLALARHLSDHIHCVGPLEINHIVLGVHGASRLSLELGAVALQCALLAALSMAAHNLAAQEVS